MQAPEQSDILVCGTQETGSDVNSLCQRLLVAAGSAFQVAGHQILLGITITLLVRSSVIHRISCIQTTRCVRLLSKVNATV